MKKDNIIKISFLLLFVILFILIIIFSNIHESIFLIFFGLFFLNCSLFGFYLINTGNSNDLIENRIYIYLILLLFAYVGTTIILFATKDIFGGISNHNTLYFFQSNYLVITLYTLVFYPIQQKREERDIDKKYIFIGSVFLLMFIIFMFAFK